MPHLATYISRTVEIFVSYDKRLPPSRALLHLLYVPPAVSLVSYRFSTTVSHFLVLEASRAMLYRPLISALVGAMVIYLAVASPVGGSHQLSKRYVPHTHVLHERQVPHLSRTWAKKVKVPGSTILPMRVGLRQTNLEDGHDLLMDRSNPDSPSFGKHMSAREVIEFFAPPRESVEVVREWLVAGGIDVKRITQSANKQVRFIERFHLGGGGGRAQQTS